VQLSHTRSGTTAVFDDPNLIASAGLVPMLALADLAGLAALVQERLSVPTDKGANAGLKVVSLVAGMLAGADSIDDMALLRHGGMGRVFERAYAPSTLGSFLRAFTFGHVRQLDAVAARFLAALGQRTPLLPEGEAGRQVLVDVDDTIIEVHGYAKQGAGFGYTGVRGLNALLATATTPGSAPVVVAQRLRTGSAGSPRGAARPVADALKSVRTLTTTRPLVRADSAYYGHATVAAALRAGADVSVTVRADPRVKAAIAAIDQNAWTAIEYREAVFDQDTGTWVSRAEVAEIDFTAFAAQKKPNRVPGRLVVRRIPDLNAERNKAAGQGTLFDTWRFHAFFTTVPAEVMDTVTADKTHRGHAVIEQVHADLKNAALAHLPSGKFAANAAWLVLAVIAFNLARAAATLTGPKLAKATTATIRRRLVHVPARASRRARRLILHLPTGWPWRHEWHRLMDHAGGSPPAIATN
jgi:Transposase DDE domain group 1